MTDNNTQGALDGVRVIEFAEGIAGPFAARLLADLGADVIKVERPCGDPTRGDGPAVHTGAPHSALFEYLNWNKRSVVLDPADDSARPLLDRLLDGADILVYGFGPGALPEDWGLDPRALQARHPGLVVVAVSEFGWQGPYANWRGSDLILQAMGGIMSFSGLRNREPLKPGLRQSYYCAGINAAYVAMAGYLAVLRGGAGGLIDLSVLEVVVSELVNVLPGYAMAGILLARPSAAQDPLYSGQPLPVSDGYVIIQVTPLYGPEKLVQLLGDERLAEPQYATHKARIQAATTLRAILLERLANERGRALFERANESGLLVGVLQTATQLLDCNQLRSRSIWTELKSDGPAWRLPAQLARLSATPMRVRRAAPSLGEETLDTVLTESKARIFQPVAGDGGAAPLRGMRVLDLSAVFAAPYMAAILADLGAEVIKVEAPNRLDQLRAGGSFPYLIDNDAGEESWNRFVTLQTLNRGKRSLVLDLKTDTGRMVLRRLVAQSDILIDNFTPRVMQGWGLTYETLRQINPRLVMLSNTGYGSTGPWSAYRAQGTTLETTMGIGAYAGYRGETCAKVGQSHPDFLATWSGLTMIMAALVHREKSGEGQWIDLGMYQLGPPVIPEAFIAVQAGQGEIGCRGNDDWGALLSDVFPAKGDDQWVAISVANDEALHRLHDLVTPGNTPLDRDAVRAAVAHWCATRTPFEAASSLQDAGIAAGPVNDARDLFRDPHLLKRGFFEDIDIGAETGVRPIIGRPYIWPDIDVAVRGPAPRYGADNDRVLHDVLNMSAADIAALRKSGVMVDQPQVLPHAGPVDLQALVKAGTFKEVDPDYRQRVVWRHRQG